MPALISVAMPVRNGAPTIAAAVRSVLHQSVEDWELLVIDDGSTDGTMDEVRRIGDPRIKLVRDGQARGLPIRLNEALSLAQGDFFARMDADDVSYPRRLEQQLAYLASHPNVDLVGGGLLVFGRDGAVIGTRTGPEHHEAIVRRPHAGFAMAHPAFFGRTNWFRSWRFDPASGGACDQDLLLRAHENSRFANLTGIVLGYREPSVVLQKVAAYRIKFARSLARYYQLRHPYRLSAGMSLIAAKMVVDTVAVSTGAQHRLLRHRARPVAASDASVWADVWRQCAAAG